MLEGSGEPASPSDVPKDVQLVMQLVSDNAQPDSAVLHSLLEGVPAMADHLVQHVPALLCAAMLNSAAGPAQVFAAGVLLRLMDHPAAASAAAGADLQPVVAALQQSPDDDDTTAQLAATLLSSLATTHEGARALAPLVPQLLAAAAAHHQRRSDDDDSSSSSSTVSALLLAVAFAGQSTPHALRPAVESVGELLQMLDSPDAEQQEAAAKLLNMLLLVPEGAAALVQDCHISGLLELLQRQLQQQQQQQQPQTAAGDAPTAAPAQLEEPQQQEEQEEEGSQPGLNLYAAQLLAALAARPAGAAALAQRRRVGTLMRCLQQVPCDELGTLVLSALAHVTTAAAATPGGLAAPQLLLKPDHVTTLVDAAGRDGLTLLALQSLVPLATCDSYVQLLAAHVGCLRQAVAVMQQQQLSLLQQAQERQQQEQQQQEGQEGQQQQQEGQQQQQEGQEEPAAEQDQEEGDDDEEHGDVQAEQQQQAADALAQAQLLLQAITSRVAAFEAMMQQNQGPAVRELQHEVVAFASLYASMHHSRSQGSSKRRTSSSPPGSSGSGHGCQQLQALLQQAARLAEACNRHFSVAAGLEAAAAGARQPAAGGDVAATQADRSE